MSHVARRIEALRTRRFQRAAAPALGAEIDRLGRAVERTGKRLGAMIELWEARVPQHLASQSRITALRSGVAHIAVGSSGALYELDRLLRQGLEQELRATAPFPLQRVKCTIGPLIDPAIDSK